MHFLLSGLFVLVPPAPYVCIQTFRYALFRILHNIMVNSGVNIFLISTSVEGVSHAYSHLSWLAKLSLLHVYGKTFSTAHTADCILIHYNSVIVALRNLLGKVSACGFFCW